MGGLCACRSFQYTDYQQTRSFRFGLGEFLLTLTMLFLTACVDNASPISAFICNNDGTEDQSIANYTCNTGYYDAGAPQYCIGMLDAFCMR